jgi:hypothetical protein
MRRVAPSMDDGSKTNVVGVVRIDPMTDEVVGEPIEVGYGMFGIGSGDGSVWAYDGFSQAITQIDAASGTIVRVIPVIDGGSSWGGDPGIDAADGQVDGGDQSAQPDRPLERVAPRTRSARTRNLDHRLIAESATGSSSA